MAHTQEQHSIHDIRPTSLELDVALPEHSRVNGNDIGFRPTDPVSAAREDRLEFLKSEAESEGLVLREDSLREFRAFVVSFPATKKGIISYTSDGNLCVSWRNWDEGGHSSVVLRFMGGGKIQYALLLGDDSENTPDPSGECDPKDVAAKIREFKLEYLLTS